MAYTTTNSIQTLAYSRITRPTHERLREEVEESVHSLKAGKSSEIDTISSELLKNGSEATTVLTVTCQKIWEMKEWPKEWIQSLVIPQATSSNVRTIVPSA